MTEKWYVRIFVLAALCFVAGNLWLWKSTVEPLFSQETDGHGDLARLGFAALAPARTPQRMPLEGGRHIEMDAYLRGGGPVDVLTIGDSFSNGKGGFYYQDLLAEKYGARVVNLPCFERYEALEMLYLLRSSGYLEALAPRAVIVESVARSLVSRYGRRILQPDAALYQMSGKQFAKLAARGRPELQSQADGPFQPRMVKANWEYIKALWQQWRYADRRSALARTAKLRQDLFSNPGTERLLLYYTDDLRGFADARTMETIDRNFAEAQALLTDKGMRLLVLPCVDKFDLYRPYVEADELPENLLFAQWRERESSYGWIDTKRILQAELARGARDLYWQDDTHWSWKGIEPVVDEIARQSGLRRAS